MMPLMAEADRPPQGVAARWRWPALAFCLASGSALFGYWEPLRALLGTWASSPSFEHGYAIVAVAAALIWTRRERIAREDPCASTAGIVVAAAATALGVLGAAGAVLVVQQFAFVLFLNGIVLAILGPRIWRILAFPLVYLFFAIPVGDLLVLWLRDLTARGIVAMLTAAGTPAVLDGYLIRLPHADYRVAEACAGLRFLLVSVACSVLAAYLLIRTWRRRVVFIGISIALPLIANALRAALLIWLAARGLLDPKAAVLHFTYGLGFTGILLSLLMLLAWFMRERSFHPAASTFAPRWPVRHVPIVTAMVAVSFLAFLPVLVRASSVVDAHGPLRLNDPTVRGSWVKTAPSPESIATAELAGADAHSVTAWTSEGARIELLLLYYAQERQGREAIGSLTPLSVPSGWTEVGQRDGRLNLDGAEVDVAGRVQERGGEHEIVWTFYWVDGRFTGSAVAAKLMQTVQKLLARPRGAVRVQLALIGEGALNEPEAVANRFLADIQPLGRQLRQGRFRVTN